MAKLFLMSIVIATFVIPMRAAGNRSPVRGLRRAVAGMAAFIALYVFGLLYILPRLG